MRFTSSSPVENFRVLKAVRPRRSGASRGARLRRARRQTAPLGISHSAFLAPMGRPEPAGTMPQKVGASAGDCRCNPRILRV